MNISGGKGVLKFFSKNKKGVSETNQAYENVGQESPTGEANSRKSNIS